MTKQNIEKIKKIIFSGCSVQYPAGEAEFKLAKSLEWQLIKAVLPGEPVHWIDGFLIFESWREKGQKGNYLALFRKVASNVKRQLEEFEIHGLKMEHPRGKQDYWMLMSAGNTPIESNILDAVRTAKKARNALCERQHSLGLELILQSYKTWQNSKALTEAIICMESLPANWQEYELLPHLKEYLADSKQDIITALAKVIVLGIEEQQGLNQNIIQVAVERWGSLLSDLNTALCLLAGKIDKKPTRDAYIEEFNCLANNFSKYFEGDDKRSSESEADLYKNESSQLLNKIINSAFVRDAADITKTYFEGIDYLRKYACMVDESLERVVPDFIIEFDFPVSKHFNLFPAFCEYLRKYVKRDSVKAGMPNVFETKDGNDSKKREIASILQDVTGIDGLRNQVEDLLKKQDKDSEYNRAEKLENATKTHFMAIQERIEKKPGRYPCLEDIENGNYYRNEDYHDSIKNKLLKNRKCLIKATPGCGKTALAVALGYEFFLDGISVYYNDATNISDVRGWKVFFQNCNKDDLVILDNVHARVEEINELISYFANYDVMLMITSRDIPSSTTYSRPFGSTHHISYLDFFSEEEIVKLEIKEETIFHIINWYTNDENVPKENIGNINLVMEKCQGDYNILRFYLEAWQKKSYAGLLSDIKEQEILDYIYFHYLKDCSYQQELLMVSALSQFEIDVESRWLLCNKTPGGNFESFLCDGLIQVVKKEEIDIGQYISWLRIYHPTVAKYFLMATAFQNLSIFSNTDEFSVSCLYSYLVIAPTNFMRVLGQVSRVTCGNAKSPYNHIFRNDGIYDVVCEIIENATSEYITDNSDYINEYIMNVYTLDMLYKNKRAEKVYGMYLNQLNNIEPESFQLYIFSKLLLLSESLPFFATPLLRMDFRRIGQNTRGKKVNLAQIYIFALWLDERDTYKMEFAEKFAEFCDELDFHVLGQQVVKDGNSWQDIMVFLNICGWGNLSHEKRKAFFDELDYIDLSKKVSKCITNKKVSLCHYITSFALCSLNAGISDNQITAFFEELDYKELGLRAKENKDDIVYLTNFIKFALCANAKGSSMRAFCSNLDFRQIGEQARRGKAKTEDIEEFIGIVQSVNVSNENLSIFYDGLYHPT